MKSRITAIIGLILSLVAIIILFTRRDAIIINEGIRAYRTIRTFIMMIVAVISTWSVITVIRFSKTSARHAIPDYHEKKSITEQDRNRLYDELAGMAQNKWRTMNNIHELLKQLDSMNEYQSELGRLLKQTKYLKDDPEKIVQRVEDCMYINIQKLLNYMRIMQVKSWEMMQEKINECTEKNADLLKKTDDFVVAVVGYVNGDMAPEEEDRTKNYVDSYMFVVLQAIELPETYLK